MRSSGVGSRRSAFFPMARRYVCCSGPCWRRVRSSCAGSMAGTPWRSHRLPRPLIWPPDQTSFAARSDAASNSHQLRATTSLRGHGQVSLTLASSDLVRRLVAVPSEQPMMVVPIGKVDQRLAQLLNGLEGPYPEQVLLESADEALGHTIAFGLAHEAGRAGDTEEGDLVLKVMGHVVRSMIVAELQTGGEAFGDGTKVVPHALADRLQRLEAIAAAVGMDADALGVAVIHGNEDVGRAVAERHGLGHVGAPHLVDSGSGNGPLMRFGLGPAHAVWGEQLVLAHQAPNSAHRGTNAGEPQPSPELAMAFPMKPAGFDQRAEVVEQRGIVAGARWPWSAP